MPIDIASGIVELAFEDVTAYGSSSLLWDRRFSNAFLERDPTALGWGWTNRYFSTLTQTASGFRFHGPSGKVDDLQSSGHPRLLAISLGSFLEVLLERDQFVLRTWNVDTFETDRYCFRRGRPGEVCPLTSIETATGQATDLSWSENNRLLAVTQRLEQRRLLLSYTAAGLIDQVTLQAPDGNRRVMVRYEYDARDCLTRVHDVAGNVDAYDYGPTGLITRERVKDGGVFTYLYDKDSRCVKFSGLARYEERTLRYTDAARVTEITDSYGRTTTYQHLPSGQIAKLTNSLGARTETHYDSHGRVTVRIDETGGRTEQSYDARGNRVAITDALGTTETFTYNEAHLPLARTDGLGRVWTRVYDEADRLVATVDPLGHQWRMHYDESGNVDEVRNPTGALRRFTYFRGALQSATNWRGHLTWFQADSWGQITAITGDGDATTRLRYDVGGNLVGVTAPDGSAVSATYDSVGNVTSVTDGNGSRTAFRYGPCRRLVKSVDPLGNVVRYRWGTESQWLNQVVNERGETYTFNRDDAGRISREESFDGVVRTFSYDSAGYVSSYTNGNSETIVLERDALHRVIAQQLPDGGRATYRLDAVGKLLAAVNPDANTMFEHDELGRVVREVQGDYWVASSYDAVGNVVRTETSLGHVVDYRLDADGFTTALSTLGQTITFTRDAEGREIARDFLPRCGLRQRYDETGRLVSQRAHVEDPTAESRGRTGRELVSRRYRYDANGSLESVIDAHAGHDEYVYDACERLVEARRSQAPSEAFSYDSAGNVSRMESRAAAVVDQRLAYGAGNRVIRKGSTRFEYDGEGRRVSQVEDDGAGGSRVWHYEWDALDRLCAVKRPDGGIWRYHYDALGRRVRKVGHDGETRYHWNQSVVLHEVAPRGMGSTWAFESHGFSPIATAQAGQLWMVVTDHLGSPRELVDRGGTVVWSETHDSWGSSSAIRVLDTDARCAIRFQGHWRDDESGLHYSLNRYYDPATAAFISADPLRLWQGTNFLSYVRNPINWIDPLGLEDVDPRSINFSQRNVSGQPGQNPVDYQRSMESGNWDWNKSGPIRVMDVNGQLVAYDNRRLMAAQNAAKNGKLSTVPIQIVKPGDVIPVPGAKKTWAKAFAQRLNDPRNRASGGALPATGRKEQPNIEDASGCG